MTVKESKIENLKKTEGGKKMFNLEIDKIISIIVIIFLSVTQIIQILQGRSTDAAKTEMKIKKQVNKLNKKKEKAIKDYEKIKKELEEVNNNEINE